MTSPDPEIIQKLLSLMVKEKITHVVLEVTAHALDQYRFLGSRFLVSAITNTSHEHLDDFINIESYIAAKSKLFNLSNSAILNIDDPSFQIIKSKTHTPITTYGIKKTADYQAKNIVLGPKYLKFNVNDLSITTDSNYNYQIYNILTALAVIEKLKIDPQIFLKLIKNFPEIKGRRQLVSNNLNIKTIVDFAHTPAALEQTLTPLKHLTKGNLIVIFGATGGRDPSKRPLMGRVSQIANIAILTADDTRNENVADINQQIISGFDPQNSKCIDETSLSTSKDYQNIGKLAKNSFIYFNIKNRQDAFNLALKIAQKGDTVIACGKGHETTILHGSTEYPWSETEAFRSAFNYKTST
jgi:UDP-N-acetylmuramoyl-L-alanyl-D-glutamate--2,6-diaminopimelate ligase